MRYTTQETKEIGNERYENLTLNLKLRSVAIFLVEKLKLPNFNR